MKRITFSKLEIDNTGKSSIKNACLRPVGMFLGIVYTPLLLNYLGEEANGVWATVLSVITWINYCDLGIGNGLRNCLAKELAIDDYKNAKETVSTAYIVLTAIAIVLLGVLLILSYTLDWNDILNTHLSVRPMMIITEVFIVLNFVFALSNSILYALQFSERVSLRGCIVQVFNIVGLFFLSYLEKGNLAHMALLFGLSTAIVYVCNTISIMSKYSYLVPSIFFFQKTKVKEITNVGTQFFIIQLTAVLILSSQNLIVSNFFGASAVTPFNTVNTAFAAIYSVMAALVVPIWSRTTEAAAKGDFFWIRQAMKKIRYVAGVFIVMFIGIVFFYKDFSRIWLGRDLDYPSGLIGVTCAFYIMQIINLIFVQFYYGMGEIKSYMWLTVLQAIAIVPLAKFLSLNLGLGVAGVKLSSTVLLLISGIVLPFLTYGKINELEKRYIESNRKE
ncbi:lipopolysaccharide biosynthesis protein [Enterocloster aldenensis]|uniref:lipopolysaccharide biosynthesis protein n=1 Tax=Enterocloster aldenensis TaxID=358742 RepID=UPI00402912BC